MMAQINLKLDDEQVERTTHLARQLCLKRAAYIRKAIDYFNEKTERELLAEQFKRASAKCRRESLKVCREFERIDKLPV
jgi:predicted transcriptional regulator